MDRARIDQAKVHVTFFANAAATKLTTEQLSLKDLAERVLNAAAREKSKLPWLKLAKFGAKRTDTGCLRHDDNVIEVGGLELDYDLELVPFADAVAAVDSLNISAMIYTSASHTPAAPRWRVVAPFSTSLAPAMRATLMARLNGALKAQLGVAEIAKSESFTLSQSFYYGWINTSPKPDHQAVVVEGLYIDQVEDLKRYEVTGGPALNGAAAGVIDFGNAKGQGRSDDEIIELLKATPTGDWHNNMRNVIATMIGRKWSDLQIRLACGPYCKGYIEDRDLDPMIDGARKRWNVPDPKEDATDSSANLERLNKVHAILPIGGKTRVVTFGEMPEFPGRETIVMTQTIPDFCLLQNKYRHKYKDADGKDKEVPMGSYWVGNRRRRQYDAGMAFMPQFDRDHHDKLNLWRGYGVKAIKPDSGSGVSGCDKFLVFMRDVICSSDKEQFDYLLKREATILQKRIRSEVALGLHSENEGVGKGFYERVMSRLLGSHAMQVTNPKHIIGAFNPHLETLLRLTADEALFVGNPEHRNVLFGLITEGKLTIEPKGCGVYQADSYLNLSITSNAKHFLPISGTARRFFIPTISQEQTQKHAYFQAIQDQLDTGGYEALLYHFLNEVDLTGFNVRVVPKTAGLLEQRNYGLQPLDAWWLELLESGTITGADPDQPNKAVSNEYQREVEVTLPYGTVQKRIVRQLGVYDQARQIEPRLKNHFNDHRLGAHLREMGCDNEKKVLRKRGWTFPPLRQCREAWLKRFPDWPWRDPEITEWRAEEQDDPPIAAPDSEPEIF